jgi:uncharacterized protein
MQKSKINYPCQWTYKLIGQDGDLLKKAVLVVVQDKKYQLSASKSSSGGKYKSFNLELNVADEEERNQIFESLKNNSSIKFVL